MHSQRQENAKAVEMRFYLCDHLGTPNALLNDAGKAEWAAMLDAWGNLKGEINPEGLYQIIGMPGQQNDVMTSLIYNFHRFYDNHAGCYINQDPVGLIGGNNKYNYVSSSPLLFSDPKGLARCTYSIAGRGFKCESNDGLKKAEIYAGCNHSGIGEHPNDPASANIKNKGPIWPGTFIMEPNTLPGREGWWALQEEGWGIIDSIKYRYGSKRGGAQLHPGTMSLGCITVRKDDEVCMKLYAKVGDLLREEADKGNSNILVVNDYNILK